MEPAHARHYRHPHYHRPNLAQYHYLERRYGKSARIQAFFATTGLIAIFVGLIFLILNSETATERKARIESDEAFYVRTACHFGDRVCAFAKEDSRRVICKLYPEDCYPAK